MENFSTVPTLFYLLTFLPFLSFICTYLIIYYNRQSNYSRLLRLPPGPRSLPIIGDLHRLGPSPHRSLQKLSSQYGDIIYLKLGQVPTVVFSSRELAEKVTKTHDLDFCSRPQRKAFKKLTYNFLDVGFSPYGDSWRHLRKLYITELLSSKRVDNSRSIREEKVAKMIQQISKHVSIKPEESIDLTRAIMILVQDVICGIILGKSWIEDDAKARQSLFSAVKEVNILLGSFCVADYFPWARWFDTLSGYTKQFEKSFSSLQKYVEEIIQKRVEDKTLKEEHELYFVDLLLHWRRVPYLGGIM